MLVLSRRDGQSIVIDNRIVVTLLRHGKNQVRLGVTAPDDVRIVRQTVPKATASNAGGQQPVPPPNLNNRGSSGAPPPAVV